MSTRRVSPATFAEVDDRRGREQVVLFGLVLLELGLQLAVVTRYGRHRDEYYFIDCGKHLAFGYVDHAPMVPWLAGLSTSVFGDSPRHLFLAGRLLYFGLLAVPIWVAGLVYLFTNAGKRYRVFGYLFVTVIVVLTVSQAKPYYSAPAFPLVFAAGGVELLR